MSYSNQDFPVQNNLNQFYPPPPRPANGPSKVLIVLAVLGGGALLLLGACCGGVIYFAQPAVASAAATQPFDYSAVPIPSFDDRGPAEEIEPGVRMYDILLGDELGYYEDGFYRTPGIGGHLRLYLPAGDHPPQSLPCVLHTGAGTTLLHGIVLDDGPNPPEFMPYVKAGFAVLAYEMDGPSYDEEDTAAMLKSYEAFRASRAGLVNARNAIEFLLQRIPEVDPKRIYVSGHSSAATHALLLAQHEPRLAGVIAFAPAVDLPKWFEPRLPIFRWLLPGVTDFVTQSSPSTHRERLKCPTLLFHAEDDSICDIAETRTFADQLRAQGTDVTLITVATGDHYESMVSEGLPAGVRWLQEKAK